MRLARFITGALGAALVGSLLAISPSQAALADTPGPTANSGAHTQPNFDLPRKVGEYYIPMKLTPANGEATAMAYPSGCGLTVLIWRNGNTITGSMTTSCNFSVTSIDHTMYMFRSRWFGWERIAVNDPPYSYGTASKATTINYDCTNTGTHDFRVEGYGYVNSSGRTYNASAYDQIDSVSCD